MFKHLVAINTALVLIGCSSNINALQDNKPAPKHVASEQVNLSHVKAYLLIGNIKKAEQLFNTLDEPDLNPQSLLVLAELHAAKGNSIEAQQVFLEVLANSQFTAMLNKTAIPLALLDYFCEQKKWPALQGYGNAIKNTVNNDSSKMKAERNIQDETFTKIGLCFFNQQNWPQAQYWLEQININEQTDPWVYLALARSYVAAQQLTQAQQLIDQYHQTKNTVDAASLWAAIEVHLALQQPDKVVELGETLRTLFDFNEYARQYILLTKRGLINAPSPQALPSREKQIPQKSTPSTPAISKQTTSQTQVEATSAIKYNSIHTIQKGETLYRISKLYGLTTAELQAWNPELDVHDIAIGTQIKVMPERQR